MGNRAGLLLRSVSKTIDLVIVLAVIEALPRAGWLAGFLYILISDGLMGGQSIGKRLIGLRTVGEGGEACSIRESILRNGTLGFGLVLYKIPFVGWLLLLAIVLFEFVVLVGSTEGRRLGDEIGRTSVVEAGTVREAEDHR
jgi:uncharacterized RDD family membrane protein YckC